MMRTTVCLMGLILAQIPVFAQTRDVNLGISISDGRLRDFYLAVGDFYGVAPRSVVELRERYRCQDDELPVVYFLAARAHVEPAAIINLRLGRMSWLDIAFHYRLTPDVFFVPVAVAPSGPPYGNAYGYYRKHGADKNWQNFHLTDREVVDLVNLRFMSEYHKIAPASVIALRSRESKFVVINDDIGRKEKGKGGNHDENGNGRGKVNKGNKIKKIR